MAISGSLRVIADNNTLDQASSTKVISDGKYDLLTRVRAIVPTAHTAQIAFIALGARFYKAEILYNDDVAKSVQFPGWVENVTFLFAAQPQGVLDLDVYAFPFKAALGGNHEGNGTVRVRVWSFEDGDPVFDIASMKWIIYANNTNINLDWKVY